MFKKNTKYWKYTTTDNLKDKIAIYLEKLLVKLTLATSQFICIFFYNNSNTGPSLVVTIKRNTNNKIKLQLLRKNFLLLDYNTAIKTIDCLMYFHVLNACRSLVWLFSFFLTISCFWLSHQIILCRWSQNQFTSSHQIILLRRSVNMYLVTTIL